MHATTVEGIAPAPSVEIVFGGGHIATLFLDGVNYTALLPSDVADRPDLKKIRS
ncbi:hypothetical protein [Sporolactobacillus inulinus]|uniref:hypothetical protein n=1 Tax=Sporolactobacillus inulinus TaxID=2078 RepID=UPI0021CCE32B|nr:hypothetical protein [Sporolactobacillus inulinus]